MGIDAQGGSPDHWSYESQAVRSESRFDVDDGEGGLRREAGRHDVGGAPRSQQPARAVGFGYRHVGEQYRNEIGTEDRAAWTTGASAAS